MTRNCSKLRLRIAPQRIHFLKYILEGYDGLAILTTLDGREGAVEISFPPEQEQELALLLAELRPALTLNP
ncbi:MAG: DUF4911 domain-containing protein [Desulfobacterales bacterium]|nr:DUF4911 domain-containing protein [Desulfobacterales bacterium]